MIRAFKISRSDQPPPSSKFSLTTINDLPDSVLVDIICRLLLDHKVVFQCKLVSKRWCTLLSDPGCVSNFVRIQLDLHKPILNRYVMIPDRFANRKTLVLTMSSSSEPPPPLETTQTSIFSVLPCLESHSYADPGHHLTVEGTYNDLVLCSQGTTDSRLVYYICNCYTKKWIRLSPPTPRTCPPRLGDEITTGFICEPYYKEECASNNRSIIKVHAEYRFRVVRLMITFDLSDKYHELVWRCFLEIFSSETGKWREFSLSRPRRLVYRLQDYLAYVRVHGRGVLGRGIPCNGKLYWLVHGSSILEFDPFSLSSTSDGDLMDKCRFIDLPTTDAYILHTTKFQLGVCRGRLQICPTLFRDDDFIVWELKENEEDDKLPEWCLLHRVTSHQLFEMIHRLPFTISQPFRVVGFHPYHGDIVYLQHQDQVRGLKSLKYIVVCNVRERTIQIATEFPSENSGGQFFSYVIPLWPTPVPSGLHFQEYLNITVIVAGEDSLTLKVDSLTTVKQLIKELEGKKVVYQQYVHELRFDGRVLDHGDKWLTEYGIKDNSHITLTRVYYDSSSRCSLQFSNH